MDDWLSWWMNVIFLQYSSWWLVGFHWNFPWMMKYYIKLCILLAVPYCLRATKVASLDFEKKKYRSWRNWEWGKTRCLFYLKRESSIFLSFTLCVVFQVCTVDVETTTDVRTIVKHCLEQLSLGVSFTSRFVNYCQTETLVIQDWNLNTLC